MAVYKVATNKGTYWWGDNSGNWQTNFNRQFPGVTITGSSLASSSDAPANLQSILAPFSTSGPTASAPAPSAPIAPPPVDYTAQAKSQLEPYYKMLIDQANGDVNLAKQRMQEDLTTTQGDINKATQLALQRNAGAMNNRGLYFSGINTYNQGLINQDATDKLNAYQRTFTRKNEDLTKSLADKTKAYQQQLAVQTPNLANALRSNAFYDFTAMNPVNYNNPNG